MNKRIPSLIVTGLLMLPGGALLAAGAATQQIPPAELNKEIVQGLLNITGIFLAILLPVAGQQLLKLRSELKTTKSEVQVTKETTPSLSAMTMVYERIGRLEFTVQTLKDDLRVTKAELDSTLKERDKLKGDNVVLIEQLEDERKVTAELSRRTDEQDIKIADLERRVAITDGINELASKLMDGIKEMVKVKTDEHLVVKVGEDEKAA